MDDWENDLIEGDEAKLEYKKRSEEYQILKILKAEKDNYLNRPDCTLIRETKNLCYIRRDKKKDEILEDKVWCMFYKMGFTKFNKGRKFEIRWSDNPGNSKQIDAFCADDETVILAECKSGYEKRSLKENIESYKGNLPDIKKSILRVFPKVKIAFLYVTEDYKFGEEDEGRLAILNKNYLPSFHFDERALENYCQLVNQIGKAAKYQLLGLLFKGKIIKNLDNKVNAIEGKMGGLIYYSFTMKPSQLLKMAYVLHRNNVNSTDDMMPSYQRIIKKDRLLKIRDFIEHKQGFFPNAIIVSIRTKDENDKKLQFNPVEGQDSSSLSRIGTLILPQEYQTAYIIDGQHRLYGYSFTSRADSNSIPVIAFVNMKKEEQVQMFMDINQNQKAVPKVLRDTLEADLLYTSSSYNFVNNAIKKRIAMKLGEKADSPLFGMVLTGENPTNEDIPLTIDGIFKALNKTNFFNKYNKQNNLEKEGVFDFGIDKNDDDKKIKTEDYVFDLLTWVFKFIKKNTNEKWDLDNGFRISNNLVGAIICLLNDFVLIKIKEENLQSKLPTFDKTKKSIEPLLTELCTVLSGFSNSTNDEMRKFKGEGGLIDAWHLIGSKIYKIDSNFSPEWMPEYLDKYCQENADEANEILCHIKEKSIQIIRNQLKKLYGDGDKLLLGIPEKISQKLNERLLVEKRKAAQNNRVYSRDLLEVATFAELHSIIRASKNYSDFGKQIFKNPSIELFKQYDNKSDLLNVMDQLFNTINSGRSLSKKDFEDLKLYKDYFDKNIQKEQTND